MSRDRSTIVTLLHARRDALLFVLISALLGFVSLYGMPERTPAEARRAAVVEQLSRDVKSPAEFLRRSESPLYDGIVLLIHRGFDEGSVSNAALRLPSLVAAAVLAVVFFAFVCVYRSRRTARITIYLLLSTFLFYHFVITGGPAMPGTLFATWAVMAAYSLAVGSRRPKLRHAVKPALLLILSGLTLGAGGLFVPALAMIGVALMEATPERRRELLLPLWVAVVVALLVTLPMTGIPLPTHNSFGGLLGCLALLLPWGLLFLISLGSEAPARLSASGSMTLLVAAAAILYDLLSGTADVGPSLVAAPFVCLSAGECFRSLLSRRPHRLAMLSAGISIVGLLLSILPLLLLLGETELPTLLLDPFVSNPLAVAGEMTAVMQSHRAMSLLLLMGPLVAALTMIYQRTRRSYVKMAYSGVLMMVLLMLLFGIPLRPLLCAV